MVRDCCEYKYSVYSVHCGLTIADVVMRCLRIVLHECLRESREEKLNDEIVKVLPT